ncbi:hypothetical protein NX722_23600 [Endozoicomonas gorgoniicola]|uniref:Uncharacterized protein n=1 Tax=Endozoicomonas gorgoniicola TaxID=1234144 RepID=A0ABT3N2J0_9GAMM|nr:hypothetical protein [Endozoicomonas gorgoniicola]MCW7555553.1 hypothetical protein [Endozoicomonas gorgoniicola]
MDIPVFVSKKDLELIHIKKLAHYFRINRLSDADAEQLAADLEAVNRLKDRRLISAGELVNCQKRIYRHYQQLVREYGHQVRTQCGNTNNG